MHCLTEEQKDIILRSNLSLSFDEQKYSPLLNCKMNSLLVYTKWNDDILLGNMEHRLSKRIMETIDQKSFRIL